MCCWNLLSDGEWHLLACPSPDDPTSRLPDLGDKFPGLSQLAGEWDTKSLKFQDAFYQATLHSPLTCTTMKKLLFRPCSRWNTKQVIKLWWTWMYSDFGNETGDYHIPTQSFITLFAQRSLSPSTPSQSTCFPSHHPVHFFHG